MQITICPSCGGRVRSESIGWKCENCQGFIDMRGGFHPHKEEPIMPPMTNADKLRSASDEELAKFLTHTVSDGCPPDMDWECKKDEEGWDACDRCWERWLQRPAVG